MAATERNVRAEADDTLRRDVIEALSKETRARQESDAKALSARLLRNNPEPLKSLLDFQMSGSRLY